MTNEATSEPPHSTGLAEETGGLSELLKARSFNAAMRAAPQSNSPPFLRERVDRPRLLGSLDEPFVFDKSTGRSMTMRQFQDGGSVTS